MRVIKISGIVKNSALILGLALMGVLSINAQNSNTGNSASQTANSNTGNSASQTANTNTGSASRQETNTNTAPANTPRVESTNTPRPQATSTTRTEVQTVVEKENGFPWGLLGLLGLAGLLPKKRSVEVAGVRETTHETRTTTENRDNKS